MLRALAVRSLANWLCVSLAVGVSGSPLLTERNLTVAVAVAQAPKTFAHPGVLLDQNQLDFIKDKVNSGEKQWTDAYQAMLESPLAALDRTANPTATVECGPGSIPDIGCLAETEDALAAYAMSLAWSISGSAKYAEKAISYMNAWAGTIKAHTDSNAPLQAGWAGATWPRAAEIIRYSNAGWLAEDITKFEDMLRNVYLPEVIVGSNTNGNWELGKYLDSGILSR